MATLCVCGKELDAKPESFRINRKPCLCDEPGPRFPWIEPSKGLSFMRGRVVRDPKRAALGLPDQSPYEKSVLKGTFHEY